MIDKKVVVISGSSKGIGRFLVDHYLSKGMIVAGCSRSEMEDPPPGYTHYCLDVSDEVLIKQMFTDLRRNFGRVDYLINNAGVGAMNYSLTTPARQLINVLNTNFVGTFLLSREAAKVMQLRRFGRIVNFSSVATPLKLKGESAYGSAKAAVVTFTHILAKELAELNITVNAVGPGPVKTSLLRGVPEEKIQEIIDQQAIHRYGTFEDVANVVDFFLKDESSLITSQVIYLAGVC